MEHGRRTRLSWAFLLCPALICGFSFGQTATPSAKAEASVAPRVVHVIVALSDPHHQRIGPLPAALGNGDDARNNEAYTLEAALAGWVRKEMPEQIRTRAAQAYDKYQHCGMKAARSLLVSGW